MISVDELQKPSRKEKLAIGVSTLFFLSLIGVVTYVNTTRVWMALIGGVVGLVVAYLRAGISCSNVRTGVNPAIRFWSLASAVVLFGWLTVAIAQVLS
ncbi:MAG TPA: hypothetical protein VHV54_27220 [Candidatus Binatia bacterium]|nr:hypothetical protein [Candidatus Binatia bacterium]